MNERVADENVWLLGMFYGTSDVHVLLVGISSHLEIVIKLPGHFQLLEITDHSLV